MYTFFATNLFLYVFAAIISSPAPAVDCKPIHPLQVKPPAAGARFWP